MRRTVLLALGLLAMSMPAFAQIELSGSYVPLLYEDYIERSHARAASPGMGRAK
jgi:hypothetical protein